MTSAQGTRGCATLLRDACRRLTHEINNAANGVAVNLEVVRSRSAGSDEAQSLAAFAQRAADQFETLTALQEILRSILQLTIDALDDEKLDCGLSPAEDAIEITFKGSVIPRGLHAERGGAASITLRNSPHGVILSLPRSSPSSE